MCEAGKIILADCFYIHPNILLEKGNQRWKPAWWVYKQGTVRSVSSVPEKVAGDSRKLTWLGACLGKVPVSDL